MKGRRHKRFRILLWFWRNRKKEAAFIAAIIAIGVLITQCTYDIVAFDSLQLSKDTSQKQLRAYVAPIISQVEPMNIDRTDASDPSSVQVSFWIKNFGQTPAANVSIEGTWCKIALPAYGEEVRIPKDFPFNIDFPPKQTDTQRIPSVIYYLNPGQDLIFTIVNFKKDIAFYNADYSSRYATFFYGSIIYQDVYNVTHVRDFCYLAFPPSIGGMRVMPATIHNTERDVP